MLAHLGLAPLGLGTLVLGGGLCLGGGLGRTPVGGALERALPVILGCAGLSLPLFLLPSLVLPGDAFDEARSEDAFDHPPG